MQYISLSQGVVVGGGGGGGGERGQWLSGRMFNLISRGPCSSSLTGGTVLRLFIPTVT